MTRQLSTMLKRLSRGCWHRHVAWPQHNHQRCLDCSAWRVYDLHRGIRGAWNAPERPEPVVYSEPAIQRPVRSGHAAAFQQFLLVSAATEGVL